MRKSTTQAAHVRKHAASRGHRQAIRMHVISEATGNLARHMTSVVLSQFLNLDCVIQHHAFCSTATALRSVKRKISDRSAEEKLLVFSAITKLSLKRSLQLWCKRNGIAHVDLLQEVVDFVASVCGQQPLRDTTQIHRFDEEYLRRIDAWEYTLQHDDSRRLETIAEADIVLLGVSRVGKTPLAAFLGSLGYRVANVAITPEVGIAKEVVACRDRAVGLTMQPRRLSEIRERRFEMNRLNQAFAKHRLDRASYYSLRTAIRENAFAESEFRRLDLPILDVTNLTVEESAAHVLERLEISEGTQNTTASNNVKDRRT